MNSVQVLADTALVDMPQVLYAEGRDSVVVRAKDNISVLLPDSCDTSGITLTVQYDSERRSRRRLRPRRRSVPSVPCWTARCLRPATS